MKSHTEPTLTKNDPCANKGHNSANKVTPTQDHYILFVNDMQAEIKQMALMHKLRSQKEALGLTDDQLRKVIRIALARLAKS